MSVVRNSGTGNFGSGFCEQLYIKINKPDLFLSLRFNNTLNFAQTVDDKLREWISIFLLP